MPQGLYNNRKTEDREYRFMTQNQYMHNKQKKNTQKAEE